MSSQFQSPFNKASQYMSTPQSYTSSTNDVANANNKETASSDTKTQKQTADLNKNQADHKSQDTNLDNSQMNLSDPASQQKAMPEEDKSSFSLTDYFKAKAREKMMNQVSSSTTDTPNAAEQPADNSPSAQRAKPAPKPTAPNNKLAPPAPERPSPKFVSSKVPKFRMPKTSLNIPKPRMR
jgi:hypothetical protein